MHRPLIACLAALAALAPGCGGDEPDPSPAPSPAAVPANERGVLDTVDRLQSAIRDRDGRAICRDVFTPALAASVERASGGRCEREVQRGLFSPDAALSLERGVRVQGERATAVVRDQDGAVSTLALVRQDGRWRIASVTSR